MKQYSARPPRTLCSRAPTPVLGHGRRRPAPSASAERTMRRWQQRRRETGRWRSRRLPRPGPPPRDRPPARRELALAGRCYSPLTRRLAQTLCALGGDTRGDGERGHHVRGRSPAGAAAQKKSLIAAERDAAARQQWREDLTASAPQRFVFLDETATPTSLTRLRARAPRGNAPWDRAAAALAERTSLASITTTGWARRWCSRGRSTGRGLRGLRRAELLPTCSRGRLSSSTTSP